MKILYHHRTRATDAQRIHILEIVHAFRELGHQVQMASFVDTETAIEDAERDAGDGFIRGFLRRIPFMYDLVQLGYNLIGIPWLWMKVIRFKPAFIYERYSLFNFVGVFVARLCGIPLILEVNSPFALEQERDGDIRLIRFAGWMERKICNGCFKVVVVSTPLKEILIESGVEPKQIVVMANGVRLPEHSLNQDSGELRRRLGLEGRTVIGFIGWFRKWHGIQLLLEAFHNAALKDEGGSVLLVGDGPAMEDIRSFVSRAGISEYVVFTGPLPHDAVVPYLNMFDIAVQPAANEYCCPMKIFEYMAAGKPIVAPRQANIEEILPDGEEALLFKPEDSASMAGALQRFVREPELARKIGIRARVAIEERGYLWTSNATRIIDIVNGG